MKLRTSVWKARSSGLNSMSIDDSPLGKAAHISVTHVYVNGKLPLATFIDVNRNRLRRTSQLVPRPSPSPDGKNGWGMTNAPRTAPGAFHAGDRAGLIRGGVPVAAGDGPVACRARVRQCVVEGRGVDRR